MDETREPQPPDSSPGRAEHSSDEHALPNAFAQEFLRRLDRAEEPESAPEADLAGPWAVHPYPGIHSGPARSAGAPAAERGSSAAGTPTEADGFAVLRQWESLERGDIPYAIFRRRETALIAAAVLPGAGRDPHFRLRPEPIAGGFAVESHGEPSGHVREFDENLVAALHVASALIRSPECLALLLEAAGHLALQQVGKILDRRVH